MLLLLLLRTAVHMHVAVLLRHGRAGARLLARDREHGRLHIDFFNEKAHPGGGTRGQHTTPGRRHAGKRPTDTHPAPGGQDLNAKRNAQD